MYARQNKIGFVTLLLEVVERCQKQTDSFIAIWKLDAFSGKSLLVL